MTDFRPIPWREGRVLAARTQLHALAQWLA